MANIPENTDNPILRPVTRLETTTKVFGGEYIPDDEEQRGISNLQAIELAERDQYIISRVGQAKVDPSGDIPGEPGIAPLDTSGKLPKSNNTSGVVFTSDAQTITNKTISYADNNMPGVVGETDAQTLTNKTISYADNNMPGVVGTSATQTLTNKTIDAKDNMMLCTATNITSSQTITPTKQMMVTAGMSGITLTLGNGPYAGYALPILAVADCQVSYTGIDGAATETLDVGSYITFIWDAVGSYWVVDAGAFEKPTYISTTQTLTAVKKMIAVVNTSGVVLTLGAGPYDGFELPVLATADCQIVYIGINGSVTKNVQANTYNEFVWDSSNSGFWLPKVSAGKVYSTSEVKTGDVWIDGRPIYRLTVTGTPSTSAGTYRDQYSLTATIANIKTLVNGFGAYTGIRSGSNLTTTFASSNFGNDSARSPIKTAEVNVSGGDTLGVIVSTINGYFTSVSNFTYTAFYTKTTD